MRDDISVEFYAAVDGDGVFDGRDLAAEMIKEAYRVLLPYVAQCPGCAEALFTVIANQALDAVLDETMATKEVRTSAYFANEMLDEQADFALAEHVKATQDVTDALMRGAGLVQRGEHRH
jgi:hypothetical protein